MKVVGIGGSLRPESYTYAILRNALSYAQSAGCEVELIDLKSLSLPFCDGSVDYPNYPDVKVLQSTVKSAHALILASPEYHGSLSGVLKNALDLLDFEHVQGKVVAIIGVLGGSLGYGASSTLRHICRQLNAWVIPIDLLIPNALKAFDNKGELLDPLLRQRLLEMIKTLVESTSRLHALPPKGL